MSERAKTAAGERARRFLKEEQAFRLGALLTEQGHGKTRGLAERLQADLEAGLGMLWAVDREQPGAMRRVLEGDAFAQLVEACARSVEQGGRIFFTGCGATGRLAILLEAGWRAYWEKATAPPESDGHGEDDVGERVVSVMAGGDFALIRSVEGFEDYPAFGKHQLDAFDVGEQDTVVAVTEGGETPFVIGTAWAGLEAGASVFFVFNNPAEVLREHVARSREVLEEPRITKLDLSCSPMAVAGSTRMQATTNEYVVLAGALEQVIDRLEGRGAGKPGVYADRFAGLVEALSTEANVRALGEMVRFEEAVYQAGGLVTYFAEGVLLDLLTDTTERSPTFSLPPFRPKGDATSKRSWAFVKNPVRETGEAWRFLLGRPVRGLTWDAATYRAMGAPETLQANPPRLGREAVEAFEIGREVDRSRFEHVGASAAVAVATGQETQGLDERWWEAFRRLSEGFSERGVFRVGEAEAAVPAEGNARVLGVRAHWEESPMRMGMHLATKLVLNNLSTATMGRLGRLISNSMVHVSTSNKKLVDRGIRLVCEQTGASYETACYALHETMAEMDAEGVVASPVARTVARLSEKLAHRPH